MVIGGLNEAIIKHARASADWKHYSAADFAYTVADSVNVQLFEAKLPKLLVGFDTRLKLKSGSYYFEGDSVSLKHHCDLPPDLGYLDTVIAIIHNMTHLYTDINKPKGQWYHSSEFRKEMAQWGITVADNGEATGVDAVIFPDVLKLIGMESLEPDLVDHDFESKLNSTEPNETVVLNVIEPKPKTQKAPTKMKKWSCSCNKPTNVRCATKLQAYCTVCGSDFELQL